MTARPPFDPWVLCPRPDPAPRLRLFCVSGAGSGAAMFFRWVDGLPTGIELRPVQLPGREGRLREPPLTRLEPLVAALHAALLPYLDRPFALFGHSMGALIAFELARTLRRVADTGPTRLLLSARRAGQLPSGGPRLSPLSDPELVAALQRRYGGIPPHVLGEPELLRMILPTLRADLQVVESYAYVPGPPLGCPVSVFGGLEDPTVSRSQLEAWQEQTRGDFVLRMLPGDHFYLNAPGGRAALLEAIAADLRPWTER